MNQRIREAEREMKYEEYAGREGDIVTGIIQQSDSRYTLLDLGRVEALLPQAEQVPYERPEPNARVKAYIVEVRKTAKGPQIVVSAAPTPASSSACSSSRCPRSPTASSRSRRAPASPGTARRSPSGPTTTTSTRSAPASAPRGARVRMVVNELRGEKIDIVPFSDDPPDFVAKALSPAKVKEVRIHEDTGVAEVIVPDYQLSLAIGKEGQNARLAARLTGWRVDIKSETQLAEEEADGYQPRTSGVAEGEWVVDAETGEQEWQPADGGDEPVAEWNERLGGGAAEAEADAEAPRPRRAAVEAAEAVEAARGRGRRRRRSSVDEEAARSTAGRGRRDRSPTSDAEHGAGARRAPVRTCVGCRRRRRRPSWSRVPGATAVADEPHAAGSGRLAVPVAPCFELAVQRRRSTGRCGPTCPSGLTSVVRTELRPPAGRRDGRRSELRRRSTTKG